MEKERENSDTESNSQTPPEASFTESNEALDKEEYSEPEQTIKSKEENIIDEETNVGKKPSGRKGGVFVLVIFIILSLGTYFYFQQNRTEIIKNLPSGFKKLFPEKPNTSTLDNKSQELPTEPIKKNIEQTKTARFSENLIQENEETIHKLQEEIQFLKSRLDINETSSSDKIEPEVRSKTTEKNIIDSNQTKQIESNPMEVSLTDSSPINTESVIKQNKIRKITPQRSKEVQAYLDFVENIGSKFINLVKKGWVRLKILILDC